MLLTPKNLHKPRVSSDSAQNGNYILDLTSSSAGVSVVASDSELFGFVERGVSALPGVLGGGGPLSRGGSSVLEQHLLNKVQLFYMTNYMLLLSYFELLFLKKSLEARFVIFRLAAVVHKNQ